MTAKEHREAIRGMLGKIRPTADLDSLHRNTELLVTVNKPTGATQSQLEQWCLIRQILMREYEAEALELVMAFLNSYSREAERRKEQEAAGGNQR